MRKCLRRLATGLLPMIVLTGSLAAPLPAIAGGTVTAEIYSCPSAVAPGQLVNVQVRIKFTGDDNDGPWQVNWIAIRDSDLLGVYQTIASVDDPFQITTQGTWYYHTFNNVRLSDWDDGGDGIELYVEAEVNDNDFNGYDPNGSSAIYQVGVSPTKATSPSPTSGATSRSINTDISWANGGGATSYDVYFGTSSSPTYRGNQSGASYDPGTLAYNTTYYWRINAKNYAGTTQGDLWSFTTEPTPPPSKAISPSPTSGATGRSINTDVSWSNGGGATSYDVYFGTSSSPAYRGNQSGTSYDPGTLAYNTTYYWRIDARNAGGTTAGDVWSFTTEQPPPPSKATSPNPTSGSTSISLEPTLAWANGGGATSYDVWLGTSAGGMTKVSSAQSGTSYSPSRRNTGSTYYWRIDAKNASGTTQGDTWTFTTCGNAGGGLEKGNTSAHEYGDAIYNRLGVTGAPEYNHAGIVAGVDSSGNVRTFESTSGNLPDDPDDTPDNGPQEGTMTAFKDPSIEYYGAFGSTDYSTTMPGAKRREIVAKAKTVVDEDIYYPSILTIPFPMEALEPESGWTAPISPSQIHALRCDGLVEYVYEACGVRVWRNCLKPDSEWSIATYPSHHGGLDLWFHHPEFEASPWAQRGATTSSSTGPGYSGPDWPDTRLTKSAPVNLPTMQLVVMETTTTYADVRISATDESGIFQITHTKPDGDGPQQYKKNPDRHPTSDTYTPATIRLVRLSGNNSYDFGAAAQDHGGNWGNVYRWDVPFLPYKATTPSPANGATGRSISSDLSWQNGGGASTYDVYFGTDSTPDAGELKSNQSGVTFDPGTLAYNTTYYWRIDSKNSAGTTEGDVWSFTTASAPSPGTLQFSASTYSVNENGASVTITVTRQGGSSGAASVNYATANGTATAGSDYTTKSGTLNWSDGDAANKTFTVSITDDAAFEGDETFTVALSSASGASMGSPAEATVTIVDNDTPARGTVQFSSATYSVAEDGSSITLNVTRQGGSYGAASVNYATANGTATAGSDYTSGNGTLNWADGDTATKTFSVPILDDSTYEGNETFTATLNGDSGASLGSPATCTVTVLDEEVDAVATPAFSPDGGAYAGSSVSVQVTCATVGATIRYTTSGDDPTTGSPTVVSGGTVSVLVPGTLKAKAWKTGMTASATKAATYTSSGGSENVALSANGGVASADSVGSYGGTTHHASNANDGDTGTDWCNSWSMPSWLQVQFDSTYLIDRVAVVWGLGAHNQTFSISLSENGTDWSVVVPSRASNTDAGYDPNYHGNTSVVREEFSITAHNARFIRINITSSSAPSSHIFKAIVHEIEAYSTASAPSPGTLQFSASTYSGNENGGTATITATRTGGSFGAASVNYATANGTATAGSDYTTKSGTLNWTDGDAANKTFTVSITDDAAFEGDETFSVSLSGASGASLGSPASATVTIIDNGTPARGAVQFSYATYSVAESGSLITLNVTRQGGSYGAASVNYATANGTASAGSDFTSRSGTLNWADGETATKTFSVPIIDDSIYEGNETFTATLSGAVGASLGSPATTTVTIQENDVQPDTQQPTIQITAPTTATTYTSPTNRLNIGGTASDNVGIAQVTIRNCRDLGGYVCSGTTAWQFNGMPLYQGQNLISVIATDTSGNSATDTVTVAYSGDPFYDGELRSGAVVQEVQFPDNLVPGQTVTVRWKLLSYVPVRSCLDAGKWDAGAGAWTWGPMIKNGTCQGQEDSTWNISMSAYGRKYAATYAFECDWVVPNKPGDFQIWFNVAQMDGKQYMIATVPEGVDARPDPTSSKVIIRTIAAGGTDANPQSEARLTDPQQQFDTLADSKKRSGGTVIGLTLPDNLTQGSQVTVEWTVMAYMDIDAEMSIVDFAVPAIVKDGIVGTRIADVASTYNFVFDGTRYYARKYTFRATFTVPNSPGEKQIYFRHRLRGDANSIWMSANIAPGVDTRAFLYNGMYGRFIERTINP